MKFGNSELTWIGNDENDENRSEESEQFKYISNVDIVLSVD